MGDKALKIIIFVIISFLIFSLVAYPEACLQSAKDAIALCMNVVIPSLFPFFVCSGILIEMGLGRYAARYLSPIMRPVFNVSGAGALAFVLGIVSGYPLGAKTAVDLYNSGECDRIEAERLLAFCNNSGPLFILGAVGAGMLHSAYFGRIIYISHILSSLLVGIGFRFYRSAPFANTISLPATQLARRKSIGQSIGLCVYNSVKTMLNICGFIIIFAVLADVLPKFGSPQVNAFITGILEISNGIFKFSQLTDIGLTFKLCAISFLISFSGICVVIQVMSIVSPSGLSMKPYVSGKLLQAVVSFIITYALCGILPIEKQTFAFHPTPFLYYDYDPMQLITASALSVLWCVVSIFITAGLVTTLNKARRKK